MPSKTWDAVFKDIKNKSYKPVYFLMGEEPFFIDAITKQFESRVLTQEEKEFNFTVFYGRETDLPTLVATAKRYPMNADYNLVIVKEAQNLSNYEKLESYFKNPMKSTILVLCFKYKKFKDTGKLMKVIMQHGVVMRSDKLYDDKMPGFITDYITRNGYKIDPRSAQLLADYLGNDLSKVVNELKKLFISLPKGEQVSSKIIEENIGISKDFNVFELQNALGTKNSTKAFQIVKYFADNPKSNPLVLTLQLLHSYFAKALLYHSLQDKSRKNVASQLGVSPFFVQGYEKAARSYSVNKLYQIFSLLHEYDMKSKGMNNQSTSHGELLKELIFKILI